MHRVELRFADGERRRVETDGAESIYQAAAGSGITLLTDCLEGACATCKARCLDGDYALVDPSFDALSSDEEAAGYVLLCQMEARSDCTVELPYTAAFAQGSPAAKRHGCLARLDQLSGGIVRVGLELGEPLVFVAGQYAQVEVPGTGVSRAYSFANPPHRGSAAEFYVRVLADGLMGDYLTGRARRGDRLTLHAPLGGFYVRPGTGPLVMVAGGTGLAPLLAMLESLAASGSRRSVTVLHGVREDGERFGGECFTRLRAEGMSVTVVETLEHPAAGWTGVEGLVTDALIPEQFVTEGTDVYLCGPPPMVRAAEQWLAALGVPEQRVFVERFNPA